MNSHLYKKKAGDILLPIFTLKGLYYSIMVKPTLEFAELTFTPIMGGKLSFASKFLEGEDLEKVKEELRVTELGRSLKQEGIEEGERKKALEIAKGLLDILSVEMIAKKTGLTIEEVEMLKNK